MLLLLHVLYLKVLCYLLFRQFCIIIPNKNILPDNQFYLRLEDIEEIIKIFPSKLDDYEKIITDNPIFLRRTKGKGVLEPDVAINNSITGVNLRASGVNYDLRNNDYLYKDFEFTSVILDGKDSWARYKARILEIKESLKIIEQGVNVLRENKNFEQRLINPLTIKLPDGEYYSEIEAPRGLASIYIKSMGEDKPYRLKWRTGSYYAVNLLRRLLVGEYLNDAIAIAGSLDIILPEVDK